VTLIQLPDLRSRVFYSLLFLILTWTVTIPETAHGQKRRKGEESPQGLRLREAEFYFTEGEKYFILEDYAKALLYYHRSLEIHPESPTVHYKIAEVLAKSNKQDDLIKASLSIENAIKLDKTNKYFYLLAASIYNSLAKFEKAAQAYESMIREVKGTEEYLYELAAIYQYANKQEDAIKVYNRAENVLGINEISSIQKTRLYIEAGKTKEALGEGEKLLNAFPEEERYIMAFTELLSQKGLRTQAITYLENFVKRNPGVGNAKMLLAGFYRDTQQEQKARPILTELFDDAEVDLSSKLIVLGAYNTELHQNRVKNVSDPDKENFAISLFEKLLKGNPESANVSIVGGDLYLSVGKNREAQKQYLHAVESGEVSFEVWENLLYLETQLEQWDAALAHAEQALEMYPNQAMIHYFNGYALMKKRQFSEAITSFDQARRLASSNARLMADVQGMLGECYYSLKDFARSDKAYEDALSLNPDNEIILNNYSFQLAVRKENLDKAEKMSASLIKNNPDNPTFLDTHAWVLYVREKYRDARKVIERAISTGKANATHFEHYGDILYQLGEVDNAVKQWEKARGMNANSETLNKKIANRKIYE
jgi:tetratricopeptide (TPR) repeat protein